MTYIPTVSPKLRSCEVLHDTARRYGLAILGLLLALTAQAAAPPPLWQALTGAEQKEIAALQKQLNQHAEAGEFEAAAKVARQITEYRARRQGVVHYEATYARFELQEWQRLSQVPASDRAEVLKTRKLTSQAKDLLDRGRPGEAEKPLRQALAIRLKVLGSLHPDTAQSYNNLAFFLYAQGKIGEALSLLRKALAILEKVLGSDHPDTATSYNNLAGCLQVLGNTEEALPLYQKALTIRLKVLGDYHPFTISSYNNVACCLQEQGKSREALPLYRKALTISEKVLGADHPDTALGYNNLAFCLQEQGKTGQALPLHQKALAIRLKVLGADHPDTAGSYNNTASCLNAQGKAGEALPLYQKALAIWEKVLGADHPHTALSYNNLAYCLTTQGKAGEAIPLLQKALAIRLRVLGDDHPAIATSYNNLAACLDDLDKVGDALPLYQKAMTIFEKVLGAEHPHTASSYNNVAGCLHTLGKTSEALSLHQKGLAICLKVLGTDHPDTAGSYGNMANILQAQGKWTEAAKAYELALQGHEYGRLAASSSGFDRSRFRTDSYSPRAGLAAMLVRLGQPAAAWEQAESDLGRGLLDDLLGPEQQQPQDHADLAELARLDDARLPLLGLQKWDEKQQRQLESLNQQSQAVQKRLAERAVQRARQRVFSRAEVQRHLPEDAALVFWLDVRGEHLGCVLRHTGEPAWARLPGSGKRGEWTDKDDALPGGVYQELTTPSNNRDKRQRLLSALHKQRLEPLEPHLKGVRRLLVVPAGELASLPIEAITDRYTISYIGSGSIHARISAQSRPLQANKLLALGDPVFEIPKAKTPEPLPLALRGGKQWSRLPGTRLEVQLLQQILPEATTLLGSAASEQNLMKLATSGELSRYRLLHLATHGEANATHPEETALILAQDALPDNAARVLQGKRPIEGRLTVGTILREWKLDADLVVLSACQTGLGQQAAGEGMLGFAQALMQRGARSVVLSRWKVDDGATALLMQRFYQNLLGKRVGLKSPLGRAEALKEAKDWLRNLSSKEAARLLAEINAKVERGVGVKPLTIVQVAKESAKEARPFEHPFYWAAFVLLGDWR